jgi:hypothetical protein
MSDAHDIEQIARVIAAAIWSPQPDMSGDIWKAIPAQHKRRCEDAAHAVAPLLYAAEAKGAREWQDISTAPKGEMFIWAKPFGPGKWSIGLAYRNVSGGWSDSYGASTIGATHWLPLPPPPSIKEG